MSGVLQSFTASQATRWTTLSSSLLRLLWFSSSPGTSWHHTLPTWYHTSNESLNHNSQHKTRRYLSETDAELSTLSSRTHDLWESDTFCGSQVLNTHEYYCTLLSRTISWMIFYPSGCSIFQMDGVWWKLWSISYREFSATTSLQILVRKWPSWRRTL